jgi:hypothetical protein
LAQVVAIAAGNNNSLALLANGTVVAWGAGMTNDPNNSINSGQSVIPPGLSNVVAVSAGEVHSLALKSDGSVAAWGAGMANAPNNSIDVGQSIVPSGLGQVAAISAGGLNSAALSTAQWIPAQVPTLTGNNVFQGSIAAASFTGSGSGLVNLNASQLTLGLVPAGALGGAYTNAVNLNNSNNSFTGNSFSGGSFAGDGSGLTGLNASQLASGVVPDARLSSSVPLLGAGKLSDALLSTNVALRSSRFVLASALLSLMRTLGQTTGVPVIASIFSLVALGEGGGGHHQALLTLPAEPLLRGLHWAFIAGAALTLLAFVLRFGAIWHLRAWKTPGALLGCCVSIISSDSPILENGKNSLRVIGEFAHDRRI